MADGTAVVTVQVRCLEQRRIGTAIVQAVWGITDFQELGEVFYGRVVKTESHANAGETRSAEQLSKNSRGCLWRVSQTDARTKVIPLRRRQRARHAGITRHDIAQRGPREFHRLLTRNDRLDLVLGVMPWHARFPAQTVVKHEVGSHTPAVLRK